MYKIRPYVFSKTLLTLYYSLIYPHIIYGIEVWGSCNNSLLNRLITLQKRAVRVITFKDKRQTDYSFPASNPLFIKLKILKVYCIFKMYISRFVFKCLKKYACSNSTLGLQKHLIFTPTSQDLAQIITFISLV